MPNKISNTANRLKEAMEQKGLRQVDLMERLIPVCKQYDVKLQKNALSQYLSGKVLPKQDKLYVLGMVLQVSEAWLMGYDVPQERNNPMTEIRMKKIEEIYYSLSEQGREMLLAQAEFLLGRESETKKPTSSVG